MQEMNRGLQARLDDLKGAERQEPGSRQLELKPSHLGKIEASLRAAAETEAQRDRLVEQLNDARLELRALQAELGALQVAFSRQQTELENYRRERDIAVGGHAEVVAILAAAATILTQQVEKSKAAAEGAAAVTEAG